VKYYILLLLLTNSIVHAAFLTVSGSAADGTAEFVLENDLVFTIENADHKDLIQLVFEAAVPLDGESVRLSGDTGLDAVYDGVVYDFKSIWDLGFETGELVLWIVTADVPTLTVGEEFTVKAGTFTLPTANAAFDLPATGEYNAVLLSNTRQVLADSPVVVPEVSTLLMVSITIFSGIFVCRKLR
jgi:hypothetical protein